jgi:hypothetical protein
VKKSRNCRDVTGGAAFLVAAEMRIFRLLRWLQGIRNIGQILF